MSTQGITNKQDTPSPVAPQQGDGRNVPTTTDRPVIKNPTTLSAEEQIQKRAEANIYKKRFLDPHEIHDSAYIDHADDLLSDIRKGINIDINAEELEYVCYKVITLEGKKASLENRIRAAVFLAELYSEFKNARFYNPGKALQILSCALAFGNEKDTCGNISIRPGLPAIDVKTMAGRDITTEELRIPDEARLRMPGFSSLAMAQYYDIKTRDTNHEKDPDLFRSAIKNLVESLATAEKDLNVPGRVYNTSTYEEALKQRGWALVQSYSILTKLLAATKDPRLEAEALKIAAMLRSPNPAKDERPASITLTIDEKDLPLPWVNASDKGATYFRTSAAFTWLQILDRKESRTAKEEGLRRSLMAEISAPGSMADNYMKAYLKFQRAEDSTKAEAPDAQADTKNKEGAKANYLSVLKDPVTDPHMRGHASVNYGTVLAALKETEQAAEVFKAILGMPSTATYVPRSSDPDVAAQAKIGLAEANITLARTEDEKAARRAEAAKVMEEILAYNNAGKAEADKLSEFTFERASLNLADIYAVAKSDEDKEKALGIYNKLLSTIPAGHTYNILRAKLGKAQTLANLDVEPEQAKALFNEVLAGNKTDMAMRAMAKVGLAELLVCEPANAAKAEGLFLEVIKSNNDPDTIDRARLGLQRAILAQPEKCDLAAKAEAAEEFQAIAERQGANRLVHQTALLEKASLLSENAETRDEAAEIYSSSLSSSEEKDIAQRAKLEANIIATTSKDADEAAQAADYLSNADNLAGLAPFFRNKAALALGNYYAKNKETGKALECFNAVISGTSDVFLRASALIGRGNLSGSKTDDKNRRLAFADFKEARTLITTDGSVPGGFRMLEIQSNKGLANIADVAPDIAKGTDTMSREALTALYKDSVGKTAYKDRYMEADIALSGLDHQLDSWHHRKGHDRANSGKIINGYQDIINGDHDEMTKNTARVHLARALQTMGQPEEAEKVLAHATLAVPADPNTPVDTSRISEIDLSEVMNNYGFIALGDSDFNLAYEYFRKASEFDQDSPNSVIYRARAAFLTEKFTKEHFTDLYNAALDKVWAGMGHTPSETRPSIEEMAQAALSDDKTALNKMASTPEGRFMVLTALEAQAKTFYAKGNSLRSVQCFEQAKRLFESWKGAGQEMLNDYLFEYQLHYDLATAYLSLSRFKDAYNEYKLIAGMPGVPNWFIKDQLNVLDPEKITVTASDNGNIDLAYRRYFERGSFGIKITENGASADTYLLLGEDKSHAVKVRFGAFEHGVIDAGASYSKDFGRVRTSVGADYYRHSNGNETIGINAAADFKVNRYLTLTLDGKYEWHAEDVDFQTYEVGIGANYSRRIGKDTTFSGRVRFAYGTQRDYSSSSAGASNTSWQTQFQSNATGESDWRWEDDGTSCYTINSGSDEKFRQRYWFNYRVYDLTGKPMSAWHISTAIDPDTRTVKVETPVYGQLNSETIDVPLNDLFIQGFAHMEGTSVVFNDSRNAVLTDPGQQPTSQQINGIDINTLAGDATKPRLQIHRESHSTDTKISKYSSVTTITVYGQDRVTRTDASGNIIYPQESDNWGEKRELYTLKVTTTTDPATGLSQKIVTMNNQLLYKGSDVKMMDRKIKAAIEEYYRLDIYAGITKKFHGGVLPDGTEVTLSGMFSAKHTPGNARTDGNNNYTPAKDQYDLAMGPSLDARIPAGNGYFSAGVSLLYNGTKRTEKDSNGIIRRGWDSGSGWGPEAHICYTANLSGNDIENGTNINASVNTTVGPYVGISRGPVNVGIGLEGPQVGVNAHLKIGDTQVLGDLPISVSATGVNIGWIPIGAELNPVSLAVNTLGKSITDSNALEAIEKEKERLVKEMVDAQNTGDTETAALLRFVLDNLEIKEGDHQANWLKESTRIPILNLLTSLTGTRARKVAGSIIQETREITGQFASFGEVGVFEAAAAGSLSPEAREAIKQYIEKESEPLEEKGAVAKVADAQDKVVRGALTPFRLIGKALHLTAEKPEEGCVSEPSFKAATRKKSVRKQIVEELALNGFIDPETGRVDEKIAGLSGHSELGLSEELRDKEEIIYNILVTAFRETKIGTTEAPKAPETDTELIDAFNKKLHEDSMYLVYRTIAERGSTPETRKEIGAILATLPQNVRTDITAFIDNLPADVRFRDDRTVKVAVERESGKDDKIKVTPETYTKSVIQGESYAGKLEIEKAAIEEFKHGKPTVESAFANLTDALSKANDATSDLDNDKVNDAVYRSALVLFMLAADDDEKAVAVQEKLETLDEIDKNFRNTMLSLKEDISDFILNRRPGSTKVFGGQRDSIKVVNNSLSVKGRRFTVREYVELSIAGKLDDEIAARIRADQLEEEMREAARSRTRHGEIKAGNRRSQEKPAVSDSTTPVVVQEAADVDAVELAEQDSKEAEKAARRERIKKAQQAYGVGTHRSGRR